jgi:hypothetical protein
MWLDLSVTHIGDLVSVLLSNTTEHYRQINFITAKRYPSHDYAALELDYHGYGKARSVSFAIRAFGMLCGSYSPGGGAEALKSTV